MEKREIASLACKILSLFIIIQGIRVFGNNLYVPFVTPEQETLWDWRVIAFPALFSCVV
ncbi:MAG: hypothetical protein GX958_06150 [Desulfitobacterium sp.]|nr:hypothetical protein [Desulfitobacterium sp.]